MQLSKAEWKVMHCLWVLEAGTAREVLERLGGVTDRAYITTTWWSWMRPMFRQVGICRKPWSDTLPSGYFARCGKAGVGGNTGGSVSRRFFR